MTALVFFQFLGGGVFAGPYSGLSRTDFSQILYRYHGFSSMSVNFRQTKRLKDIDLVIKSQGRLTVVKPQQVTWEILKPNPLKVVISNSELILETGRGVNKKTETWSLQQAPSNVLKNLSVMFLWLNFDADKLYDNYHVSQKASDSYILSARPGRESVFSNLEMYLNQQGHVNKLILREKSGDSMTLFFDKPRFKS